MSENNDSSSSFPITKDGNTNTTTTTTTTTDNNSTNSHDTKLLTMDAIQMELGSTATATLTRTSLSELQQRTNSNDDIEKNITNSNNDHYDQDDHDSFDDGDSVTTNSNSTILDSNESNNGTSSKSFYNTAAVLAKDETAAVLRCRILFLLILLLTTIGVSLLVYFFSLAEEEDDFVTVYEASSERIVQSFHETLGQALGSLDIMSVSITNHALTSGSTFPNVLTPNFEILGSALRILMRSLFIVWTPLVYDDQRESYEAFVKANQQETVESEKFGAILRSRQDEKFGLEYIEPTPPSEEIAKHPTYFGDFNEQIYTPEGGVFPNGTGPYVPILQQSPSLGLVGKTNNVVGGLRLVTTGEVIRTHQAVLGPINTFAAGTYINYELNNAIEKGHLRHESTNYDDEEPTTPFTYPVFDNFNIENRTVVGFLFANVAWKLSLLNILPPNVQGIHCVIENSKGQNFTYQVDGPDVTYLGLGDHHDPKYDHMVRKTNILDYIRGNASPFNQGYTAVDLNNEFIRYELRIYPTDDMKSQYVSRKPIWYALLVASVFAFTSCAFFLYDYLVEKRQAVVMDKAVKSTAVVSSLFPKQVRDRLLEDALVSGSGQNHGADAGYTSNTKGKRRSLGNSHNNGDHGDTWKVSSSPGHKMFHGGEEDVGNTNKSFNGSKGMDHTHNALNLTVTSRPIADKFESATIMFADLAGFTRWSAEREADQVFFLLETIYRTFDAIAARRKVFKVETIGDCYMCVTGVPEIQPDHAIRMIKFARECLSKMETLVLELAEELGPDTAELGFRVGLHSGPVTAGVLRGERSRFQLFGDTVNTAARMESNGEKGRIHVSQSTADELILIGKGGLLQTRKGTISVKGKGKMQTYFLIPQSAPRTIGEEVSTASPLGHEEEEEEEENDNDDNNNSHNEGEEEEVTTVKE